MSIQVQTSSSQRIILGKESTPSEGYFLFRECEGGQTKRSDFTRVTNKNCLWKAVRFCGRFLIYSPQSQYFCNTQRSFTGGVMASKRHQRRRSCESKVRHPDEQSAQKHAHSLKEFSLAYSCPFCHGWHVGRPDKKKRQSLAAKKRNRHP